MRYGRADWYNATRAEYLRAFIQRDEMALDDLARGDKKDRRVRDAIRLAKRRLARNTRELNKL